VFTRLVQNSSRQKVGGRTQRLRLRFAPKSGHVRYTSSCPLWANSGHRLFDYFVGTREYFGRRVQANVDVGPFAPSQLVAAGGRRARGF